MLLDEAWRLFRWPARALCGVVVVTVLITLWATGGMGRLEWIVGEMGRLKARQTTHAPVRSEGDAGSRDLSR